MGLGGGSRTGLRSLSRLSSKGRFLLLLQALAPGQVTIGQEAEHPEACQRPHGQHLSRPDPGSRRRGRRRPRTAPGGHSLGSRLRVHWQNHAPHAAAAAHMHAGGVDRAGGGPAPLGNKSCAPLSCHHIQQRQPCRSGETSEKQGVLFSSNFHFLLLPAPPSERLPRKVNASTQKLSGEKSLVRH